jgi:hypothetical protein
MQPPTKQLIVVRSEALVQLVFKLVKIAQVQYYIPASTCVRVWEFLGSQKLVRFSTFNVRRQ